MGLAEPLIVVVTSIDVGSPLVATEEEGVAESLAGRVESSEEPSEGDESEELEAVDEDAEDVVGLLVAALEPSPEMLAVVDPSAMACVLF